MLTPMLFYKFSEIMLYFKSIEFSFCGIISLGYIAHFSPFCCFVRQHSGSLIYPCHGLAGEGQAISA
jgi:hypothetical protein